MAGNASVTLTDGTYELWIQSLNTSTQNEFMAQQLRDGMSWIPIRRSEMFLNFTALWPLVGSNSSLTLKLGYEDIDPRDGFAKMMKFQDAIRNHQVAIVNGKISDSMVFTYYNNTNDKSPIFNTMISQSPLSSSAFPPVHGFIQHSEKPYVRFQNQFSTSYTMNILTIPTGSDYVTGMVSGTGNSSYAPTAADQRNYGSDWVNINTLVAQSKTIKFKPLPLK